MVFKDNPGLSAFLSLFITNAFFAFTSFAAPDCTQALNTNTFKVPGFNQVVTFEKVDEDLSPRAFNKFKKRVISQFSRVNRILPTQWIPEEVTALLNGKADNAFFMGGQTLWLSRQMEFRRTITPDESKPSDWYKVSKHPNKTNPVIHHELGHYIFDKALQEAGAEWSKVIKISAELKGMHNRFLKINREKSNLMDNISRLKRSLINGSLSKTKKLEVQNQIDRLEEKYNSYDDMVQSLESKAKEIMRRMSPVDQQFLGFLRSYHELFSDLIAVLVSGDKDGEYDLDVVHDSLYFTGQHPPDKTDQLKSQNFSRRFGVKIEPRTWTVDSPHLLFNPVRSFIGRRILERNRFRHQQELILTRITTAIFGELDYFYFKAQSASLKLMDGSSVDDEDVLIDDYEFNIDPGKMNSRLIRAIKMQFDINL